MKNIDEVELGMARGEQGDCTSASRTVSRDSDGDRGLNQRHVLRYIAELTEEMSRLADAHECAELADELAAVAKKARQKMIDGS